MKPEESNLGFRRGLKTISLARATTPCSFTVASTVSKISAAKPRNSAQRGANQLASGQLKKHTAQRPEKLRQKPSLNYKSAALDT